MTTRKVKTVCEVVLDKAREQPNALALTGDGGDWTYGEMAVAIDRLARGYVQLGFRRGDCVGLLAENRCETVIAWLAGARIGVVVTLINARFTDRELSDILARSYARALIYDAHHAEVASKACDTAGIAIRIGIDSRGETGTHSFEALLDASLDQVGLPDFPNPGDMAELSFTSGTTSAPKGVVTNHERLQFLLTSFTEFLGLDHRDKAYAAVPLFHAAGFRDCVLRALIVGGSSVIRRFSARRFWSDVATNECTYLVAPEGIFMILETLASSVEEGQHNLRFVVSGGKPEFLDRAEKRFGLHMLNGYGMTETGPVLCPSPNDQAVAKRLRRERPDGMYLGDVIHPEVEIRLVDPYGHDVPDGTPGEILVRSPGMFLCYLDDPVQTASTIVDGWVRTGDIAVRGSSGGYYFIDREKDIIRRAGENISPTEIEDVLLANESVSEAVVFGVPDPVVVEEVKAVVVLHPQARKQLPDLWKWCDEHLAGFKVPRYLEERQTLPRSAVGKMLRRSLAEEQGASPSTIDRLSIRRGS